MGITKEEMDALKCVSLNNTGAAQFQGLLVFLFVETNTSSQLKERLVTMGII